MIQDDQGGTKNPYKCMNVMKQDAMDDNIKHVKSNVCKKVLIDREVVEFLMSRSQPRWIENLSRIYQLDRNFLDGSRIYRDKVQKTR